MELRMDRQWAGRQVGITMPQSAPVVKRRKLGSLLRSLKAASFRPVSGEESSVEVQK